FAGAVLFLGSCVSNKQYVYLQKDDVNKKGLPKDTILRTYAIDTFDYKIQSNDVVSIQFKSLTDKEYDIFSGGAQQNGNLNLTSGSGLLMGELVDELGEIPFPVVGKVKIAGLNVFEAQEKLQSLAEQYLQSPVVKVRLINYRITILGEVNREGSVTLFNNRVNMMEAIGLVGGLTDLSDKANIKLIRQRGTETEIVYVNLLDENFIHSPYYYVYQNDVLIIPALRQRPFRKYFGQNLALIASSVSILLLSINLINSN
ncbi:MAG: polysaccharide biosynthesis/export family protein, partial [Chryseolinea sp.]